MNPSAPFINRPVMTFFVMMAILIVGLMAFKKMPVSDLPTVEYPMIHVQASYAGANPETMAQKVTVPLEKELMNINGVKHLYSTSGKGTTSIALLFNLDKSIDDAAADVQAALAKAEPFLPSDLDQRPSYSKSDAHSENILYLILTSSTMPLAELYDYAHTYVEPHLARIDGVGKVNVYGTPYAVRIQLNPELMAARQVSFEEVTDAIRRGSANIPLGILSTDTRKLTIELPAQLQNAKDFENLILTSQNPLQAPVRIKEIAHVIDDLESDNIFHYVTKDKSAIAVILGVQKQNGANTVKISTTLRELLPTINKDLPPAMHLELWFDKASWIKEAILDVEWSLLIAFALVILVIFLSLGRLMETAIPSLALPVSIIGSFILMSMLGFSLDILSLLALTLSVGFVVDDAIVVLENIVRHHEKGETAREAALKGSKEIAFTIVSMTLSLVAVFIPLLFMGDVTGRLFHEFSMTLAIAILISGFVSLTLTPMLCSRFLSKHAKQTPFQTKSTAWNRSLLKFYETSLKWCFKHRKITMSFALVSFGLTIFLFKFLPVDLFPQEDRGYIWTFVQMPKGISKEISQNYENKINEIIKADPTVESFISLDFQDFHIFLIRLIPLEERPAQKILIQKFQTKINEIPGILAFMRGLQLISPQGGGSGGMSGGSYQYVLRGIDFNELQASAQKLKTILETLPEFPSVKIDLEMSDPKLSVHVFEEEAKRLGLSKQHIQSLLQQAYSGSSIGHIYKSTDQYKVFLEIAPEFRKKTDALSQLYLKTSYGTAIPLKALAEWKETVGLASVNHVDLLPAVTISFDIAKDAAIGDALKTLEATAKLALPASVSGKLEGQAEMIRSTVTDTIYLILLSILAMYIVLGILYESFIHPLTILSSLPLAGLGGILTLLVFREPLSLYSMIGFILLIGIVKKNGIMMIDHAIEVRKHSNMSSEEGIFEACLVRFRPIMMTTISAIMGALPIAIGIGAGAETRRGLGLVIAGGLIFSQLLTLYVTPVFYLYMERFKERLTRKRPSLEESSYS